MGRGEGGAHHPGCLGSGSRAGKGSAQAARCMPSQPIISPPPHHHHFPPKSSSTGRMSRTHVGGQRLLGRQHARHREEACEPASSTTGMDPRWRTAPPWRAPCRTRSPRWCRCTAGGTHRSPHPDRTGRCAPPPAATRAPAGANNGEARLARLNAPDARHRGGWRRACRQCGHTPAVCLRDGVLPITCTPLPAHCAPGSRGGRR